MKLCLRAKSSDNRLLPEPDNTEEAGTPEKKKKGCRGCLVRLGVFGLIILALLLGGLAWLNGPGFRWLAQKYGPDALTKAGFEGDFQISGTLLKGPQIDSINLSSETNPLKSLTAKNLRLKYNILELKELKIEGLTADSLTIDLDLDQKSPEKEKEEDDEKEKLTLAEQLAKYRPLATHPEIKVDDLNVHVHKSEQNFYRLQQASLLHKAGSDTFELTPGTVTDFENKTFQPSLATITWGDGQFNLSQIPLANDFSALDLLFKVDPYFLEGNLGAYGCSIEFSTDLQGEITALLGPEPLDLKPFLNLVPAAQDATTQVTKLKATASKLDQEFSEWALDLSLTLDGNSYQKRELPETTLTLVKEELELETTLNFAIPDHPQQIYLLTNFEAETAQSPTTAWKNSASDLTTELASLGRFLKGIAPTLNLPTPPDGWPEGKALLLANIGIKNGEPVASHASFSFNQIDWAEATFEKGELTVDFVDIRSDIKADLVIEQSATSILTSRASYHPQSQDYAATFSAKDFDAQTLGPFIRLSVGKIPLTGNITFNWQGSGNLPDLDSYRGELSLEQTRLSLERQSPIHLTFDANYQGISQVEVEKLVIEQEDQKLEIEANWNGERVKIPKISLIKSDQQLVTGALSAPFSLDTDFENYFTSEESISMTLNADRLDIPRTCDLLSIPIPEGLNGTLTLDLAVAGSPAMPSLGGKLLLESFALEKISQLPPTTARLAWATAGSSLSLDGTLEPQGRNPIIITGNTGFFPKKWAEDPESVLDESFTLQANAPNIDLAPFADLSPKVKTLVGQLAIDLRADGTFRNPNLVGSVDLDLPKARFDIERLRRVRQTKLKANFAGDQINIAPFATSVDGALFELTGSINIADTENPAFDFQLIADKALVWRNDLINSRADALVYLKGTLQQARLSGEIELVESLFYKDIELLPLDVPVSVPKTPKLPSVSKKGKKKGNKNAIPIPEPFDNWTLDLKARTGDPFLIRGNLTTGEIEGDLTATGTLSNPEINGEISVTELSAALPFSTVKVTSGKATFSSKTGFIPKLDIRAQSRIPPYEIDLFVAGTATSPSIIFTSNPPLPENEVITLVATGTTPAGLEDADAARSKAFQLLIEQVRRAPPGSVLHPLARFAEPLKDVELQVGGVDPFTGKRRNSITIPVPTKERWWVSAAVDAESNTRGLVIYVLKFH